MIKIRAGVVLFDDKSRLLLVRQNKRPFWVLPGGTMEAGETLGTCAVREIKEETNLKIELGPLLYVGDFFAPDGRQVIDIIFVGHITGGRLRMETSGNLDEVGFFTRKEMARMSCKPREVFEGLLTYWDASPTTPGTYLGGYR